MTLDLNNRELTYGAHGVIKQSPTMLGTEDGTESTTASKSWQELIDESQNYENENEKCRKRRKAAGWEAGEFGVKREGSQSKTGSTGKGSSAVDHSRQSKLKKLVVSTAPP